MEREGWECHIIMDLKKLWKEHPIATIIVVVIILILLFSGPSKSDLNPLSGYSKYRVNISVEIEEYDRLGRELEYYFEVNGYRVRSGDIINSSDRLICYAKVIERDSYTYPDIGYNSVTLYTNSNNDHSVFASRNKAWVYVRVYEYGGISNAGASALFKVTFTFTGIK